MANRPITIGVVSRLESIKGMDLVVPAFVKVKAIHPDVRLLIVGDGTLRGQMEQQVQTADISDSVEFAGRQPQETLVQYYDRIDILLMPSRSEGFGLTAIEGMARGCVIVASRVGGLPEVVRDGEVGLLHESENIDDLASKLICLCESPELWRLCSARAIACVKRFGFDRFSLLFNNLYKRITE